MFKIHWRGFFKDYRFKTTAFECVPYTAVKSIKIKINLVYLILLPKAIVTR